MRKLLGTVAVLTVALAFPLTAAWSQSYPVSNTITMSDNTVTPGQTVSSQACCFSSPVDWIVQSTPRVVGTSTPDGNGVATLTWTVPADLENGQHTLTAQGFDTNGQPIALQTTFTVSNATSGGGGGGGLTPTGTNSIPWLLVGLGSVAVGGTFVGLSRRRTRA